MAVNQLYCSALSIIKTCPCATTKHSSLIVPSSHQGPCHRRGTFPATGTPAAQYYHSMFSLWNIATLLALIVSETAGVNVLMTRPAFHDPHRIWPERITCINLEKNTCCSDIFGFRDVLFTGLSPSDYATTWWRANDFNNMMQVINWNPSANPAMSRNPDLQGPRYFGCGGRSRAMGLPNFDGTYHAIGTPATGALWLDCENLNPETALRSVALNRPMQGVATQIMQMVQAIGFTATGQCKQSPFQGGNWGNKRDVTNGTDDSNATASAGSDDSESGKANADDGASGYHYPDEIVVNGTTYYQKDELAYFSEGGAHLVIGDLLR